MAQVTTRHIEFIYFDAGGGHRAAAAAIVDVIGRRFPAWRVSLVNLQKLLMPIDPVYRLTKVSCENVYNEMLRHGWTFGSLPMLRGLQRGIRFYGPTLEKALQTHWQDRYPDLVVSLIPNFNGVLFRSLKRCHPRIPYVTVMTDIADMPPRFWQERQDQFIVCCSPLAFRQARQVGFDPAKTFKTSGVPLQPSFYLPAAETALSIRQQLKLDPKRKTALIMFGGNGSNISVKIVNRLNRARLPVQTIVLCGRNMDLLEELKGKPHCHPIGFTDKVAAYMEIADFFIGKPGPASVSEALQKGLPVIIENSRRTLPQERYNARWVRRQKLGIVIKNFKYVADAVASLLEGNRLAVFRRNAKALDNRAVFEIPDIFDAIMERSSPFGFQERARADQEGERFGFYREEPSLERQWGA